MTQWETDLCICYDEIIRYNTSWILYSDKKNIVQVCAFWNLYFEGFVSDTDILSMQICLLVIQLKFHVFMCIALLDKLMFTIV